MSILAFYSYLLYTNGMKIEKDFAMWEEFSDFELAILCRKYQLEDLPKFVFASNGIPFTLANRAEVERALTEHEMTEAFGV